MPASDAALAVEAVTHARHAAFMTHADIAVVAYVRKLTRTPAAMSSDDVTALRTVNLTDRSIYDVCSIAGFFSYVNRVALGLGVSLESNWEEMSEAGFLAKRRAGEARKADAP